MSNANQVAPERRARPDILRWIPPTWDHFAGNRRLKRFLMKLLRSARRHVREGRVHDLNRLCFVLTGESRSGKTAMVTFFVRCLACLSLDEETLNPCNGQCENCRSNACVLDGNYGIFSLVNSPDGHRGHVHYQLIDATMVEGPSDLRDRVRELRDFDEDVRVVYIDETHRLVRREMDEILLKAIEQKGYIWIFSTAKPDGLEDMFLNRLIKVATELPEVEEMERWIADRCDEWQINWEPEAVMRVVEKSNRVAGTALHAVALAALDPEEGLTLDLVENDWVVQIEG